MDQSIVPASRNEPTEVISVSSSPPSEVPGGEIVPFTPEELALIPGLLRRAREYGVSRRHQRQEQIVEYPEEPDHLQDMIEEVVGQVTDQGGPQMTTFHRRLQAVRSVEYVRDLSDIVAQAI